MRTDNQIIPWAPNLPFMPWRIGKFCVALPLFASLDHPAPRHIFHPQNAWPEKVVLEIVARAAYRLAT
jgi:hypothetical protein